MEMTDLKTAAQQALEALDEADTFHRNLPDQRARRLTAITNLRAALAQQAEPQDAELSAALGWPGGISEPVLDRKTLLRQVADLRAAMAQQDERFCDTHCTWADHAAGCVRAEPVQEPVQEPVAYIHRQGNYWDTSERHLTDDEKARGWTEEPLYTAPPQRAEPLINQCGETCERAKLCAVCASKLAEPVEPVAWECKAGGLKALTQRQYDAQPPNIKRHYTRTAPPQRLPLTEEEIEHIGMTHQSLRQVVRAAERAVWEKNHE